MSNRTSQVTMPAFFPAMVFLGIFVLLLVLLMPEPVAPQYAAAAEPTTTPVEVAALATATELPPTLPPTEAAAAVAYTAAQVTEGQGILQSACSACHGLDSRGITGLGKDILGSEFVHNLSDDELLTFITTGRDTSDPLNTTGIPMPPRGGNPSLTDDQLRAIIAYLRTNAVNASTGSAAPTAQPTVVAAAPSATSAPLLEAPILPTTIPVTPQPFTAQNAYIWSCAGCHGADGAGNLPFAEGFLTSSLLDDRAALLNFLSAANPPTDPNVEYQHIYRGGYPELTDEQLAALADYVLTLKSE